MDTTPNLRDLFDRDPNVDLKFLGWRFLDPDRDFVGGRDERFVAVVGSGSLRLTVPLSPEFAEKAPKAAYEALATRAAGLIVGDIA